MLVDVVQLPLDQLSFIMCWYCDRDLRPVILINFNVPGFMQLSLLEVNVAR